MSIHRQRLLARLHGVSPDDDPTAFVLLWTYIRSTGLGEVENDLIRQGIDPKALEPMPERAATGDEYDTKAMYRVLMEEIRSADFDVIVLRSLKRLDRRLAANRGTFEAEKFNGLDDKAYRIRPLNNRIADFFAGVDRDAPDDDDDKARRGIGGACDQSLSLAAYCRNFRLVPAFDIDGLRIDCLSRWADASVLDRLRQAFEKRCLHFLCWPLQADLHYEESNGTGGSFVRVTVGGDVASRHQELSRAVDAAKKEKAAVLILPELSMAMDDVPILRNMLSTHAYGEFPILTIAGLEHRPDGDADVNEALLLGPTGKVLLTHRKLTRYRRGDVQERIKTGTTISVLESPIGNITLLICLDLFNDTVQPIVTASHANVMLVPSLSESTTAHMNAAYGYLGSNFAATMVTNRWFGNPDPARNQTFTLLPGKNGGGKTLKSYLIGAADYLVAAVE